MIVILDSFFRIPGIPQTDNEFGWIRDFCDADERLRTAADLFRTRLIPGFIAVFGLLIPLDLQAFYVAPARADARRRRRGA